MNEEESEESWVLGVGCCVREEERKEGRKGKKKRRMLWNLGSLVQWYNRALTRSRRVEGSEG